MTTRLWQVEHPYYVSVTEEAFDSWPDFLESWDGMDEDLNLVFRFDWQEGEDHGVPEGKARLVVGYVHQRKGSVTVCEVGVTREDEPAIRAWLENKLAYLLKNWAPLEAVKESSR